VVVSAALVAAEEVGVVVGLEALAVAVSVDSGGGGRSECRV